MTGRAKPRTRHAASRARKLTAGVSVLAFVAIGQAINVASRTTGQTVAATRNGTTPTSLASTSRRSAAVPTTNTNTAVTSTHAS